MVNFFNTLLSRQTETTKALECFESALLKCQKEAEEDESYYTQISVTIR